MFSQKKTRRSSQREREREICLKFYLWPRGSLMSGELTAKCFSLFLLRRRLEPTIYDAGAFKVKTRFD
jgi:hypothetical protein